MFLEGQGDSDEEIEFAVRRTHLRERIWKLEEILCEPEEILDILSEEGWKREEIEDEMKQIEQIPPIRESEWYFCTHF